MKDKFYAVVDDDGIFSLKHDAYNGAKAIFDNIQDAENLVSKYPDIQLNIEEVAIVEY